MGALLDLAVIALAVMVTGSLLMLAWTLGVSTPLTLRRARTDLVVARLTLARAERRLLSVVEAVHRRQLEGADQGANAGVGAGAGAPS